MIITLCRSVTNTCFSNKILLVKARHRSFYFSIILPRMNLNALGVFWKRLRVDEKKITVTADLIRGLASKHRCRIKSGMTARPYFSIILSRMDLNSEPCFHWGKVDSFANFLPTKNNICRSWMPPSNVHEGSSSSEGW